MASGQTRLAAGDSCGVVELVDGVEVGVRYVRHPGRGPHFVEGRSAAPTDRAPAADDEGVGTTGSPAREPKAQNPISLRSMRRASANDAWNTAC